MDKENKPLTMSELDNKSALLERKRNFLNIMIFNMKALKRAAIHGGNVYAKVKIDLVRHFISINNIKYDQEKFDHIFRSNSTAESISVEGMLYQLLEYGDLVSYLPDLENETGRRAESRQFIEAASMFQLWHDNAKADKPGIQICQSCQERCINQPDEQSDLPGPKEEV